VYKQAPVLQFNDDLDDLGGGIGGMIVTDIKVHDEKLK